MTSNVWTAAVEVLRDIWSPTATWMGAGWLALDKVE